MMAWSAPSRRRVDRPGIGTVDRWGSLSRFSIARRVAGYVTVCDGFLGGMMHTLR